MRRRRPLLIVRLVIALGSIGTLPAAEAHRGPRSRVERAQLVWAVVDVHEAQARARWVHQQAEAALVQERGVDFALRRFVEATAELDAHLGAVRPDRRGRAFVLRQPVLREVRRALRSSAPLVAHPALWHVHGDVLAQLQALEQAMVAAPAALPTYAYGHGRIRATH